MDGSILLKNWAYGKRKMSIDTRQCTRKTSQLIDSNEENELVCVCDSQTQDTHTSPVLRRSSSRDQAHTPPGRLSPMLGSSTPTSRESAAVGPVPSGSASPPCRVRDSA